MGRVGNCFVVRWRQNEIVADDNGLTLASTSVRGVCTYSFLAGDSRRRHYYAGYLSKDMAARGKTSGFF